jgi:hypothetical protein
MLQHGRPELAAEMRLAAALVSGPSLSLLTPYLIVLANVAANGCFSWLFRC